MGMAEEWLILQGVESWDGAKQKTSQKGCDSVLKDEQSSDRQDPHVRTFQEQGQLAQGVGMGGGNLGITGQCSRWCLRDGRDGRLWPNLPGS